MKGIEKMKSAGRSWFTGAAIAVLTTLTFLTASGCGEKKPEGLSLNAAIVPGADVTIRVDVASARASAIGKMIEEFQESEGSDAPLPAAVPESETWEKLMKATGLEKDDLTEILATADVGSIDPDALENEEEILKVGGVLAFGLAKPLSREQMKAGFDVLAAEDSDFKVSEITVGGDPAFKLSSAQPDQPEVLCAPAADEKSVFFSLNESSLLGALERAKSGKFEGISSELAGVDEQLAAGSQVRWAFLLSESQRQEIRKKIDELEEQAESEPGAAGMIIGFVKPFREIKSVAMGLLLTKDMGITITGDLGGEEQALQASTIIQTMLLPMAKSALAKESGSQASPAADSLKVESSASTIKISMTLTEEEIRSGMASKDEKQASAEAAPGSSGGGSGRGDL
jgi:hypothetical protein